MICKICNKKSHYIFSSKILNKYKIKYFHCKNCDFLQTEEPYWLEEAYSDSINISDTGYIKRNINISQKLTILLSIFNKNNEKYLDFAGGYGVLVRIMRDIGFNFYWYDKFTSNIFAKGFEYKDGDKFETITSFESFEHFINPMEEIDKLLTISKSLIFSTELLLNPIPKPEDWWYYGLEHGQHISFYSEKTFNYIAEKYRLNFYNFGTLKVFTKKSIPFYAKTLIKLSNLGLYKIFHMKLKSKTWEDFVILSEKNENTL